VSGGLLLVHAHPDDEVLSTGGTIARSLAEGRRVDLVVCTGGEEGEIHDPDLDPAEAQPRLRDIRDAEVRCSLAALAAAATPAAGLHLHQLGHRDSGMMDTPANAHPDAFWGVDLEQAAEPLVRIIRETRPAVAVHYDPFGGYGHPDHIQAHRIAVAACAAASDPDRYPAAGSRHQVGKRYETAFSREQWTNLLLAMRARGLPLPWDFDESLDSAADGDDAFGTPESAVTTRVEILPWTDAKRAAMACHRTQRQDFGWALDLPLDLFALGLGAETYILRELDGASPPDGLAESSLFDGL
jgi:LmbE family N-acetylglucosaminyl deacetylase